MKRRLVILSLAVVIGCFLLLLRQDVRDFARAYVDRKLNGKTVEDRLREFGPAARTRWTPYFTNALVAYPPNRLALVAFKDETRLLVYAASETNGWKYVRDYKILAASGELGPKLREGDRQVPEGIYGIESLNPNSRFHLSLRVGYPNSHDRERARQEGRANLGGDIMIHGNAVSIGCLAMGDQAAEDLFVLAADTGLPRIVVVLSPTDFRLGHRAPTNNLPAWTGDLYSEIQKRLKDFPKKN
jgi:hypothetical protein